MTTLNEYLNGKRISKEKYDDLKIIIDTPGCNRPVLDWFCHLQSIETVGWRPKLVTQKIAEMLSGAGKESPVEFYSLFCPSYKKGIGVHGFRTDDVGNTTLWGIEALKNISEKAKELGIICKAPRAIFFDIALEQPEKSLGEIADLQKNIENLKKHIPKGMKFELLSELFPFIFDTVGYKGVKILPLPVPKQTLDRIIERGAKFYELFGWSKAQIKERSKVIASSEALVGNVIRYEMPDSIMVYTPTMLERAQVYSGHKFETDPLPIIFPKHDK